MSTKKRRLTAAVTLMAACGVSAATAGAVRAATPECGPRCISVFSSELGTMAQPNFVEAVLGGGEAKVGQPVGLKRANRFDPSQDILPQGPRPNARVSDFYAAGLVSAEANEHYGSLPAVQQQYAPFGIPTGLCVGLARVAYQNQELTLQPCSAPGTTVWVIHSALSPTTPGSFPIINASTTDFERPFAMHLPRNEVASGQPLQMELRHLQYRAGGSTLPARQIWGAVFGPQG